MQIIDKNGYLDAALGYIERVIISGRGLRQIAQKTRINEDLLKSLSLSLVGLSENDVMSKIQEKLEERHGFLSGADAEVCSAYVDISLEKKLPYLLLRSAFEIMMDGQKDDTTEIEIKIFSRKNIQIS
jgi:hypothetical protein